MVCLVVSGIFTVIASFSISWKLGFKRLGSVGASFHAKYARKPRKGARKSRRKSRKGKCKSKK